MAKLSLWLPPFSPDYSGVSSVLFDFRTVTAMHDASGCTGNYTGYDEPRWYGSRSGIFCSGLREMDAVLGDDEALIQKMEAAAEDVKPDFMALVGSPVPMVIGADLKGIAAELEARTKIPCFGFDTTGTAYYDRGTALAARSLLDRFAGPEPVRKGRVNLLGALPMDFGTGEDLKHLETLLSGHGFEPVRCLSMGGGMEELKKAGAAQVNLALSRAGFLMALSMERTMGIPWLCGFPAGENGKEEWLRAMEETMETGVSRALKGEPAQGPCRVLVIGEQVMANSIRRALFSEFGIRDVAVGCIFGMEPALALSQDLNLSDEASIQAAVRNPDLSMVIADPFMKVLLDENDPKTFLAFSQYAVSSKLGGKDRACMTGAHFNQWYHRRRIV